MMQGARAPEILAKMDDYFVRLIQEQDKNDQLGDLWFNLMAESNGAARTQESSTLFLQALHETNDDNPVKKIVVRLLYYAMLRASHKAFGDDFTIIELEAGDDDDFLEALGL